MQDLTLIRDEDTVHLRSHEPQLHPPAGSRLETIEDSGTGWRCRTLVWGLVVSQEGFPRPSILWVSEGL